MQPSLLTNKKTAIIGGGPVGLMLAVLLQQRGADVTVFERDHSAETARTSGGSLDVHAGEGQLALDAAGLLPRFRQLARPTGERMADQHGHVEIEEETPTGDDAYDRPEIDRADLNQLLLAGLKPGTVAWNHNFQSLESHDGHFLLHFTGQPDQVADLVIGASGGRSRVRPYVSDAVPYYTGTFGLQGDIPNPATSCPAFGELVNKGNLMVRVAGNALFAHTKADGSIHYYLSFRRPADWLARRGLAPEPAAGVAQLLAEELAAWAPLYHEAFRATPAFDFLPLYQLPMAPNREVTQPITLVGDAAHLMVPFAGVGVNIGLVDALHLAENLTSNQFPSLEAAIAAYEQTMYGYAHQAQQQSAAAELAIHSPMSNAEMIAVTRSSAN